MSAPRGIVTGIPMITFKSDPWYFRDVFVKPGTGACTRAGVIPGVIRPNICTIIGKPSQTKEVTRHVLNNARYSRPTTAALATIQVRSYSKWSYRREFGVSEVR